MSSKPTRFHLKQESIKYLARQFNKEASEINEQTNLRTEIGISSSVDMASYIVHLATYVKADYYQFELNFDTAMGIQRMLDPTLKDVLDVFEYELI